MSSMLDETRANRRRAGKDRLAAIYTDNAVFYGGRPGHSVGKEQVRAYFASYAGVLACHA